MQLSSDMKFTQHIDNVITGVNRLVGMTLRSFRTRSQYVMIIIWKSIIQPRLDYCSQLWSPGDQANITKLETVLRSYTSKIAGCDNLDFWQRLKCLKLSSQERRRERYMIIFLWKISEGLIDSYSIPFVKNPRRGRLATVSIVSCDAPAVVRKAREASLSVKGARLFNLLPADIRNMEGTTVDTFKHSLDRFLDQIPDQPTVQGIPRAAITNSLIDQIPMWTNN